MPTRAKLDAGYFSGSPKQGHHIAPVGINMDPDRKRRIEDAGFKFGTVGELLGLTAAEEELIEMKVGLAEAIRKLREAHSPESGT